MSFEPTPKSRFLSVSEFRAILGVALPLSFGYLADIALGFTDNVMLGRLGPDALGAAGLALSLYNTLMIVGIGMIFPIMLLISQARGVGRARTAGRIIRQGLWIAGMLSIPSLAVLWNLETILLLMGQDPLLAEMAAHYMDYYMWTILPAFTSFVFIYALTGMGRTMTISLILWFKLALNAFLNYALIFGKFGFPAMGMAGAGLGSIIAYGVGHMAFFGALGFHRFFQSGALFRRAWQPRWDILTRLLQLGWPRGLELLAKNGLYAVMALLAGRLGIEAIASHTIAYGVVSLLTVSISIAVGNAVSTHIGVARGQEELSGAWGILNSGLLLILLFILPVIVLIKLFSPWVVMLFVGSGLKAQSILPVAAPLVVLVTFFALMDGLRLVIGYALHGLADMKMPSLITTLVSWGIGLPCGLVLVFVMNLGVMGLWWGITISTTITTMVYLARFRWMIDAPTLHEVQTKMDHR
uniref:Multidrug-efflux transporter n=1 Tax=Candidatus Kentrum sp. SD TaxID=2126332 RepID=A0A450YZ01_9GAMM|nr:MAG: multidrug resistance protein, MATE family [Candidatus Kentron sp. SD]VFK46765.1 MAG: multidrug resistance protein, MATE family [Candidatus Kentron sp. SD]VFK80215.1 MAG: multidrug resistance protein, MATE family [Candidatus Kentron sp. SD]